MHVETLLALSTIPESCFVEALGPLTWLLSMCVMLSKPSFRCCSSSTLITIGGSSSFPLKHLRARATLHVFLNTWILTLSFKLITPTGDPLLDWSGIWSELLSLCFMLQGAACASPSQLLFCPWRGGCWRRVFLSFHFFSCSWFFSSGWSRDDRVTKLEIPVVLFPSCVAGKTLMSLRLSFLIGFLGRLKEAHASNV